MTGAIIEGSYMAGWQDSLHGLSKREIEAAQGAANSTPASAAVQGVVTDKIFNKLDETLTRLENLKKVGIYYKVDPGVIATGSIVHSNGATRSLTVTLTKTHTSVPEGARFIKYTTLTKTIQFDETIGRTRVYGTAEFNVDLGSIQHKDSLPDGDKGYILRREQ